MDGGSINPCFGCDLSALPVKHLDTPTLTWLHVKFYLFVG